MSQDTLVYAENIIAQNISQNGIYNVVNHGLLGDGLFDNSQKLVNAISFVNQQGGGILYFPPGTYLIGNTITTLCSNLVFMGSGASSIIKLKSGSNCIMFNVNQTLTNVQFRDMAFDGNGANQNDGAARADRKMFVLQNISKVKVINCDIHDGRSGCLFHMAQCDESGFFYNRFYNVGASSTFMTDATIVFNSAKFRAIGNTVDVGTGPNPDTAFPQLGMTDSVVIGNTIVGMHQGVSVSFNTSTTCYRCIVSDNTIFGSGLTHDSIGIGVGNAGHAGDGNNNTNIVVADNIIYQNNHGIEIDSTTNIQVTGNIIDTPTGTDTMCIEIGNSGTFSVQDVIIRDNDFSNANRAIYFHGPNTYAGNIILEDNTFKNVTTPLTNVSNPAAAKLFWRRNVGLNPIGNFTGSGINPSTPAVPATTVAQTNTSPYDVTVYITANAGGTTAVSIGGVSTGITIPASGAASFRLPCQQTITLTYTSAPTWTWFGD